MKNLSDWIIFKAEFLTFKVRFLAFKIEFLTFKIRFLTSLNRVLTSKNSLDFLKPSFQSVLPKIFIINFKNHVLKDKTNTLCSLHKKINSKCSLRIKIPSQNSWYLTPWPHIWVRGGAGGGGISPMEKPCHNYTTPISLAVAGAPEETSLSRLPWTNTPNRPGRLKWTGKKGKQTTPLLSPLRSDVVRTITVIPPILKMFVHLVRLLWRIVN